MPADLHPAPHATAISIIHEVRAAPARQHENAKAFQLAAPNGELFPARDRRVDDRFCQLGHPTDLPKTHQKLTTRSKAAGDDVVCYRGFVTTV
jgi:hypothetical protein